MFCKADKVVLFGLRDSVSQKLRFSAQISFTQRASRKLL